MSKSELKFPQSLQFEKSDFPNVIKKDFDIWTPDLNPNFVKMSISDLNKYKSKLNHFEKVTFEQELKTTKSLLNQAQKDVKKYTAQIDLLNYLNENSIGQYIAIEVNIKNKVQKEQEQLKEQLLNDLKEQLLKMSKEDREQLKQAL